MNKMFSKSNVLTMIIFGIGVVSAILGNIKENEARTSEIKKQVEEQMALYLENKNDDMK